MGVDVLVLLLLIFAAICFGAAAFGANWGRVNLIALGLLSWVVSVILGRL